MAVSAPKSAPCRQRRRSVVKRAMLFSPSGKAARCFHAPRRGVEALNTIVICKRLHVGDCAHGGSAHELGISPAGHAQQRTRLRLHYDAGCLPSGNQSTMPRHPASSSLALAGNAGRAVSLADVAMLAGVSPGTVSRALSRPEMIRPTTRMQMMAAVERLGYVTNGAARSLAMRRTMTVGAIVPRFGSSSFPTMIQALETRLAAHGYTLLLSAPEHKLSKEPAILRTLLERGVDAVALLGEEQLTHALPMLPASRIPFVLMWAPPESVNHAVGFSEREAAALVVAHLAALGHQRLGFIGGRTGDNARAQRRFHGFTVEVAKRGMTICEAAMIETDYGFEQGYAAMDQIIEDLDRADRPTAGVCGNDSLAAGALSALDRAAIEVPRALSIISFNDNDFASYLHPPLTTVRLPIREMGEQAGAYLIARLRGAAQPERVPLHVGLVVRQSTGPAFEGAIRRKPAKTR